MIDEIEGVISDLTSDSLAIPDPIVIATLRRVQEGIKHKDAEIERLSGIIHALVRSIYQKGNPAINVDGDTAMYMVHLGVSVPKKEECNHTRLTKICPICERVF